MRPLSRGMAGLSGTCSTYRYLNCSGHLWYVVILEADSERLPGSTSGGGGASRMSLARLASALGASGRSASAPPCILRSADSSARRLAAAFRRDSRTALHAASSTSRILASSGSGAAGTARSTAESTTLRTYGLEHAKSKNPSGLLGLPPASSGHVRHSPAPARVIATYSRFCSDASSPAL